MGYAGGSDVFNGVATQLLDLHIREEITAVAVKEILGRLAKELADEDWDTYDESYYAFMNYPVVVSALREVWPNVGLAWEDSTDEELDE